MTYTRKTKDIYNLYINYGYGHGWELEVQEDTFKELRARIKEYRNNCNYPLKWARKRIKLNN